MVLISSTLIRITLTYSAIKEFQHYFFLFTFSFLFAFLFLLSSVHMSLDSHVAFLNSKTLKAYSRCLICILYIRQRTNHIFRQFLQLWRGTFFLLSLLHAEMTWICWNILTLLCAIYKRCNLMDLQDITCQS